MKYFGVGRVSPLWQAGFTGNPFRTLTDAEWEELVLLSAPVVAAFYQRPVSHLQIRGDVGAGKSSALRAVLREAHHACTQAVYEYIPRGTKSFRSHVLPDTTFCLDEAQRLDEEQRKCLLQMVQRYRIRLCLGTHEDFEPVLSRAQLPIQTIILSERTHEEYADIWKKRLMHFARLDTTYTTLSDAAISFLHARFKNDLRSAERFLYRYFQERVSAPYEITESDLAGALPCSTESQPSL